MTTETKKRNENLHFHLLLFLFLVLISEVLLVYTTYRLIKPNSDINCLPSCTENEIWEVINNEKFSGIIKEKVYSVLLEERMIKNRQELSLKSKLNVDSTIRRTKRENQQFNPDYDYGRIDHSYEIPNYPKYPPIDVPIQIKPDLSDYPCLSCAPGPQGPPGPPGVCPPGAPGDSGKDGTPGTPGEKGKPGSNGPTGPPGSKGDPGLPGSDGVKGSKGSKGSKGDKGTFKGAKGSIGDPGPPGSDGPKGPPGSKGDRGTPGVDGPRGPPGSKGEDSGSGAPGGKGTDNGHPGPPGEKGSQGTPGSPGPKGTDGRPGAPGEKGDRGRPGSDGPNGPPGSKGEPGRPGLPGTKGLPGPVCTNTTTDTGLVITVGSFGKEENSSFVPKCTGKVINFINGPKTSGWYNRIAMPDLSLNDNTQLLWEAADTNNYILLEYKDINNFTNNHNSSYYDLRHAFDTGTKVIYDKQFYYKSNCGYPTIIKYSFEKDIEQTLFIPGVTRRNLKPLYGDNSTYFDFNVDENGLWVIFAVPNINNIGILKINTEKLTIENSWNITLNHNAFSKMFIDSGILYLVQNTNIPYACNLCTRKCFTMDLNLQDGPDLLPAGSRKMWYNYKNKLLYVSSTSDLFEYSMNNENNLKIIKGINEVEAE